MTAVPLGAKLRRRRKETASNANVYDVYFNMMSATPATDPLPAIQSLWIGDRLSALEQLSIRSFLDRGHAYHLYSYGQVENVPTGVVLCDGNAILPENEIFQYRTRKSFAAFSNFFRYKLLLERGGYWADTDVVCLRPFAFPTKHVFASESVYRRGETGIARLATSCVIRAPAGSPAMAMAWETCLSKDKSKLEWGEIGPRLVSEVIAANGLDSFMERPERFCPVIYSDWRRLIAAEPLALPHAAHAVHFWNEMWRLAGMDKDAAYPPSSLYETLKRRHPPRTDTGAP